jgi:DNA end-binding protein Ku
MPPHSLGSGTISFGLVSIPVRLYTAASPAGVSFNQLHGVCGSRIRQQTFCPKCNKTVERSELVRGYEFAKDQYVQFTPEEIKALEEAGSHAVEISEFVPLESIDPVYFDKTYYLSPDKGAGKPYGLLIEAMKEAKLAAVGRWATRGKAYIVLIRPINDVLTMQQLHFAADVRPSTEVEVPKTELKAQELKLAKQLIEQQTSERFDPAAYKDEHRGRIQAEIQKKVEGQEISVAEIEPESTGKVIDLMEALRASLERTESAKESAAKLGPRKEAKRVEQPAKTARKAKAR